jgi:hypothetical protein
MVIAVIVWVVPIVGGVKRSIVVRIERIERRSEPESDTEAEAAPVIRAATKARRIESAVALVVIVPVVVVVVRVVVVVGGVVVPRHMIALQVVLVSPTGGHLFHQVSEGGFRIVGHLIILEGPVIPVVSPHELFEL